MPILVTNNFPPSHGGVQTLFSDLALSLHERGLKVVVVAASHSEASEYDKTLPYSVLRYPELRRPAEVLSIAATYLKATSLVDDQRTFVSGWWPAGVALAMLPRAMRGSYYVISHGMEICPSRGGFRQKVLRYVYECSDASLPVSTFTKQLLIEAGVRGNISLFTPGVRYRPIQPKPATNPTIISVGRLIRRKGFDKTLEAISGILSDIPNLHYDIIGDGPEREPLESLAESLGISSHVQFHGRADEETLKNAYARAWCFALPTRRIIDDVEGFGLVYLEAAMAELPTIGGIDSGACDAIAHGETGFLVDGEDVSTIALTLKRLLTDRELSARLGRQGKLRVERDFQWPQVTSRLLATLHFQS